VCKTRTQSSASTVTISTAGAATLRITWSGGKGQAVYTKDCAFTVVAAAAGGAAPTPAPGAPPSSSGSGKTPPPALAATLAATLLACAAALRTAGGR
jgi:hypothetical protein